MFTALQTLATAATMVQKASPSSTKVEPGSPVSSDMDINSSSEDLSPPSLLFKLDLEDEVQSKPSPIIPHIDKLFDKPEVNYTPLPELKDLKDVTPFPVPGTTPNRSLWDKNRTEAMSLLTNPISDNGKDTVTWMFNQLMKLKRPDNEDWTAPPYEDWTPSQRIWDRTKPSSTSTSDTLVDSDYDGEDEDYPRVGVLDAWPSPPPSPIHGNSMRPPTIELSGENPGEPWLFNTIGSPDYFRLLIPDPAMPRQQIVAPWVKYDLQLTPPEIAGTFGKGYPVIRHALRPAPVDYLVPPLSPAQLAVLDGDTPYSAVIDYILLEHCPKDLLAGVLTYRHYYEAQQNVTRHINILQEKYSHYLERRMEALSALENANILGRILAHTEEFEGQPEAYASFFRAAAPFHGHVTYSGTNSNIDRYMSGAIAFGPPAGECHSPVRKPSYRELTNADIVNAYNSPSFAKISTYKAPIPSGPRSNLRKRCHKCRARGHIRRDCPTRKYVHFRK